MSPMKATLAAVRDQSVPRCGRKTELLASDLVTDRHDLAYEAELRAAAIFLDAARSSQAS